MAYGPGKYDDVCTKARELAEAQGTILLIFSGRHGNGFSVQAPLDIIATMPAILRETAKQIEDSFSRT